VRKHELCPMKYLDWQKSSSRFRAMTGMDIDSFNKLLSLFEEAHDSYLLDYKMNGSPRNGLRRYVMYGNAPLPCIAERLAFILSYNKLNPIQEAHADMFSITRHQCHEFVHGLNEILRRSLVACQCMPASTDRELQQLLCQMEEVEDKVLIHDGTEREIPRPVDDEAQKDNYSGKKKRHTVKNAVIINAVCLILFVSQTFAGRIHDKTLADTCYRIPAGFTLLQDTGYQGYAPDGMKICQPVKKPKEKELNREEKQDNRQKSAVRVRVEHAIGSVKRYRIVKDECRLRKNNFVGNLKLLGITHVITGS